MYTISPSVLLLGWMATISCLLAAGGRMEAAAILASVVTSAAGMLSEAGSLEAGREPWEKRGRDVFLQLLALAAFCARLAVFAWRSLL